MKKIIYVLCIIFIIVFLIYSQMVKRDNSDLSKCPGVCVLKVYNKADTIYYTESLEEIYLLLNMKIIDLSACKDAMFESMVSHSAIEVDSVLFDKLNKKKIKVEKEVQKVYFAGGVFAVLDCYMEKNNVLKDVGKNGMSIDTEKYIFYLAYLHGIYFNYTYIVGDEYMEFYYTLEESAYKKLVKYRDSIKER